MITITRRGGSQQTMRAVGLLATVFLLFQPGTVRAQSNVTTNGGTIGKIPKWTATSALGDSVITELNGNVGIGTTSPVRLLHIGANNSVGGIRIEGPLVGGTELFSFSMGGLGSFGIDAPNIVGGRFLVREDGNVGIGTTNPGGALDVQGGTPLDLLARVWNNNGTSGTATLRVAASSNAPLGTRLQFTNLLYYVGTIAADGANGLSFRTGVNASSETSLINRMTITPAGNVGIGTTAPAAKLHVVGTATITGDVSTANIIATGNVTATGNIAAKYQDVAEWVPASRAISAGTVVVLDTQQSNHVLPSDHAYDTRVAGVVSAKPGVLLGEGGEGKVMVATTGRVRVKVDATSAPIRVGDLLVTSDKEGIAMRSHPLDLGGTPIHRPGTLIGKALEPLDKGIGEILVLLSLQ